MPNPTFVRYTLRPAPNRVVRIVETFRLKGGETHGDIGPRTTRA